MDRAAVDLQRPQPARHLRPRLDLAAFGLDRHPAAVLDPALGRELCVELDEHLRLQLGEPRQVAAHRAGGVLLREPEGRGDDGVARVPRRGERVVVAVPAQRGGVRVHLRVESVLDRRLERLVVRRHRPVQQAARRVQPGPAVAHHDERVVARDPVHALGVVRRLVVGALVGREVRDVVAGPACPAPRPTRRTSCAPTTACPAGRPRRGCRARAGWPATPSPTRARPSRPPGRRGSRGCAGAAG